MTSSTHYSMIKASATTAVMTKKKADKRIMAGFMLLSIFTFGALLWMSQPHAAELNLYAKNYKEQNDSHLKSAEANPDTKIFVSNHQDDDNISMLESGYDMMGSSGFDAGSVPAELALQHAKAIKADTVLVYSKYSAAKTPGSKLQFIKEAAKTNHEIDPKDLVSEPTQYHYYASYWAKLPMPLLGVHVIKLIKKTNVEDTDVANLSEEKGLKIIAVIKASPAAKANIVKGDTLLKIGDVDMEQPDDLFAAVKRYAGQTVVVELQHDDTEVKTSVALNALQ